MAFTSDVAKKRAANGDTVASVTGTAPTTKTSAQIQFTTYPRKSTSIVLASKRKFVKPAAVNF